MKSDPSSSSWPRPGEEISLQLYVDPGSPESQRAMTSVRELHNRYGERWSFNIVDVTARPDVARDDGVRVVPTLIRSSPNPPFRAVGDFSDLEEVMITLRLHTR